MAINKKQEFGCACEHQIIWFFDYPTILACPKCERTYYHDVTTCPVCKGPICYFELSEESKEDFFAIVDSGYE